MVETQKWIISFILCICMTFAGMTPANDIVMTKTAASQDAPIAERLLIGNGLAQLDAVITEDIAPIRANDAAKITKRKGNGFHRNIIRNILSGIVPALLFSVVNLTILYLNGVFGDVKQRMSIIIYIHNQDGQKGACLS